MARLTRKLWPSATQPRPFSMPTITNTSPRTTPLWLEHYHYSLGFVENDATRHLTRICKLSVTYPSRCSSLLSTPRQWDSSQVHKTALMYNFPGIAIDSAVSPAQAKIRCIMGQMVYGTGGQCYSRGRSIWARFSGTIQFTRACSYLCRGRCTPRTSPQVPRGRAAQ